MAERSVFFIDRGDVPSLAGLAIQPETTSLILWHLRETDAAAARRREAVAEHARLFNVRRLIEVDPPDLGVAGLAPPAELVTAQTLLHALMAARGLGCRRIVWPVQIGGPDGADTEGILNAVDRADAVAALAADVVGEPPVAFDLPLVDLTDVQIVDLIQDAGVPADACWPFEAADAIRSADGERWRHAHEALGVPWPWTEAADTVGGMMRDAGAAGRSIARTRRG